MKPATEYELEQIDREIERLLLERHRRASDPDLAEFCRLDDAVNDLRAIRAAIYEERERAQDSPKGSREGGRASGLGEKG